MAVNPVIPISIGNSPCTQGLTFTWKTYSPIPLFLIWSPTPPTRTETYRSSHGRRRRRVYVFHMTNAHCIEEMSPTGLTEHTFKLPSLPEGTRIWAVISTLCDPSNLPSHSPAFPIDYPTCPPTVGWAACTRTSTNVNSSVYGTPGFPLTIGGNPDMRTALALRAGTVAGTYRCGLYYSAFNPSAVQTRTFFIRIRRSPGVTPPFAEDIVDIAPLATVHRSIAFEASWGVHQLAVCEMHVVSAARNINFIGDSTYPYWYIQGPL